MTSNITKVKPPLAVPLPSTLDEIPPSDIRRHPLSLEELRDIRSLIGAAAKKGTVINDGTGKQQPLAGRRVMVPVTSKAFFEGTLQPPTTKTKTNSPSKGDDAAMQEQIVVNGGGGLVEMTRGEAGALLDKQLDELAASSKKKPVVSSATTKSSSKKSSIKSNTPKKTTPAASSIPKDTSTDPILPLVEIRETCDVSGNILNSEVVNMSNTMERLKNVVSDNPGGDGGEEDGKQLGELLAQTLKEGECDITKDAHNHTTEADSKEDNKSSSSTTESKESKVEPVSDADYEALCSRLEELERLEEEDGKSKRVNVKSSKRLQSGGWSKGFLNNTKKKSAPKKKEAKTNTKNDANAEPNREKTATPSENKSRVSFSNDNKIKEIPRIGQTKVPPRPATSTPARPLAGFHPTSANNNLQDPDDDINSPFSSVSPSIPFEENVFRGVVKERNNKADAVPVSSKKKLSRFAQQRLDRE